MLILMSHVMWKSDGIPSTSSRSTVPSQGGSYHNNNHILHWWHIFLWHLCWDTSGQVSTEQQLLETTELLQGFIRKWRVKCVFGFNSDTRHLIPAVSSLSMNSSSEQFFFNEWEEGNYVIFLVSTESLSVLGCLKCSKHHHWLSEILWLSSPFPFLSCLSSICSFVSLSSQFVILVFHHAAFIALLLCFIAVQINWKWNHKPIAAPPEAICVRGNLICCSRCQEDVSTDHVTSCSPPFSSGTVDDQFHRVFTFIYWAEMISHGFLLMSGWKIIKVKYPTRLCSFFKYNKSKGKFKDAKIV